MKSWIKVIAFLGLIGLLGMSVGCPQREQTLGEKVEDAADDAGDAIDDAGDEIGEEIEEHTN